MPPKIKGGLFDLRADHEGQASLDYLAGMDKRMSAFKRMYVWALANDLKQMVSDKIPSGKKYDKLLKSLKVGELQHQKESVFAVYIDTKSKHIKKIDAQKTVIYIRPRRIPTRTKPEVQLLIDKGPWTIDTIPFWPAKTDALIIQRKVNNKAVEKINKLQDGQKDDIRQQLRKMGKKEIDEAIKRKTLGGKRVKAISDVHYEMMTLEFGGGQQRGLAMWRSSLQKIPSMQRTLLGRYRTIAQTLEDPRYKNFHKYPKVDNKVKLSQINSFKSFQKQVGGGEK